jgi:uncharacterized RDD family membrane protein YckC
LAILASVLFIMFGSTRRRTSEDLPLVGGMRLAPPSLRLLAGLIDLAPVVLTVAVLQIRAGGATDPADLPMIPLLIASLVYLLHTFIGEALNGRSLGKMITGLRVMHLDGSKPSIGSIVARNALRAIDLFPPLLILILFTPMHQRLGDIVAGTTVVSTSLPVVPHADDPERPPQEPDEQE